MRWTDLDDESPSMPSRKCKHMQDYAYFVKVELNFTASEVLNYVHVYIYIKHSLYNNIYINRTDRWLANYPTESF